MNEDAFKFELTIDGDNTILPGMKSIMADKSDKDKVTYIPNVEYVKRDEEDLQLQILLPRGLFPGIYCKQRFPLVVFVQGAAWQEQEMYMNIPQLSTLAKKGYVVASVKHRSSLKAKFPAYLQDVKSAIRFLRANAETYFINPDQVAIWGDSSGGNAALLVGVTGDMKEYKTGDNHDISDSVKAVVDFYGPTDSSRINEAARNPEFLKDEEHSPERIVFGGSYEESRELWNKGNPLSYISEDKKIPPIFIAHGDHDAMVPFKQSVYLVEKLIETNKAFEFYKVCGADHGIYLWTDELINKVDLFLRAYLEME